MILNFASFTFLSSCLYLHLILWIPSDRLLTRFDNELAINLVLSVNCNIWDIFFVISSPILSIVVTSFFIGTVKVMHFLVFSYNNTMIVIVRSIIKNCRNFFRYTIFWIIYAISSTYILPYIMTVISNFMIFFIFHVVIIKFFVTNITNFCTFIWFLLLFS